jgi:predicted dehydrogenase
MKTIQWGIIGVGDVTERKSGPGFQKATNSALVAVMRRNGALAQDYAQRHNIPRWYDDAQQLIDDPNVDAVYIATPPHVHKEYTLLCAAAGKPVLVEKPMALNFAECQAMLDACQQAQVPLWVAYYRRRLPRFLKIKELLDSGAIGDVRSVVVKLYKKAWTHIDDPLPWRVQPEISGGGLFLDVGVHILDILDYLLGAIQGVNGFAVNQAGLYAAEDHVIGNFVFESGAVGTGDWCFSGGVDCDHTLILGTKGQIEYTTFQPEPIILTTEQGQEIFTIADPQHVHQPLIQSIVDELNGSGKCPSTGESGARTTAIVDKLLQDYRAGSNALD